jgi:hypothetical protein
MLFKLLVGMHQEGTKTYKAGAVIESDNELDKLFVNKFQRLRMDPPSAPAAAGRMEVATTPSAPVSPTATGGIPQPGEQTPPPVAAPVTTPAAAGPKGRDVTARFPIAVEQDYKVFKDGGLYFVYAAEDLTKAINPDGAARKDDIAKLVTAHLNG